MMPMEFTRRSSQPEARTPDPRPYTLPRPYLRASPCARIASSEAVAYASTSSLQARLARQANRCCEHMTLRCVQRILLCGWGETAFMSNLLRELASGPAALPRNSEIVLFNALTTAQQQQRLADCSRVGSAIGIRHVQGNPLNRSDMAHKIDISECAGALGPSAPQCSC